jgi:hypothetical protein
MPPMQRTDRLTLNYAMAAMATSIAPRLKLILRTSLGKANGT